MRNIMSYNNILRPFFCFMLMGIFSVACAESGYSSAKIIIKGDHAFPPYEFINDQGEPDGFNVEITRAVMSEMKLSYELYLEYWPQVVNELRQKKIDVITGMMYSNRRAQEFKFGAIHSFVYLNVVFRKGEKSPTELSKLKDLQVIVQAGAITHEIMEEDMPLAHLIVVDDLNEGFRLLSEGKYDVVLCNQEMAKSIIYKQGFNNLEMSELNLSPKEYCFVGNNDSLILAMERAFYKLKRNGTYDQIYNKWFSIPGKEVIPQWVYVALTMLVLTIAISYLFILLLRRKVKKANEEIRRENYKLSLAIKGANMVFWEFDRSTGTFKCYNEPINSFDERHLITLDDYYQYMKPDDIIKLNPYINLMEKGCDESYSVDIQMKSFTNEEWCYCTIICIPFEKDIRTGKVMKYVGFRRDITDLIVTQHQLKHETEKALQADKLKSAFLANMSHEIRTPLNAIVGFSELLQETENLQERAEYMQIIKTNNELLLNLVNDILDLSRIESGTMTLNYESFDLSSYFSALASSLQQRLNNTQIEFIVENPYKNCMVCLDRHRIAQLFTNFTTNAIKHTQVGHIRMGYVYDNGGIRIYVEDTGIGIPKSKQHLVFQRFEKLDSFTQGTGLGLSICKAIIDTYKGKIGFVSDEGKGSTFWAWIPCDVEITQNP